MEFETEVIYRDVPFLNNDSGSDYEFTVVEEGFSAQVIVTLDGKEFQRSLWMNRKDVDSFLDGIQFMMLLSKLRKEKEDGRFE